MDNIKVLEEIGLKKVSEETHIEVKYLKYMVDGQFDKLNRINTLGFIKILSREYNLDLSEWAENFEDYWQANRKEEQDDGLFIVVETNKSRKKFLVFLLIVILVTLLSFTFSVFKDSFSFTQFTQEEEKSAYTSTQTIEETKESLKTLQEEEQFLKQNEEEISFVVPVDANETEESIVNEVDTNETMAVVDEVVETNTTQVINQVEEKVESEDVFDDEAQNEFTQKATIKPNSELWIGVIYLDNFKRRSFLGEGEFSLDLSRDQIITTGHGSFLVSSEAESFSYTRQSPIRLLIQDGKITEISWSKFKEFNQGNPW